MCGNLLFSTSDQMLFSRFFVNSKIFVNIFEYSGLLWRGKVAVLA